jgi:hypothetical protein
MHTPVKITDDLEFNGEVQDVIIIEPLKIYIVYGELPKKSNTYYYYLWNPIQNDWYDFSYLEDALVYGIYASMRLLEGCRD